MKITKSFFILIVLYLTGSVLCACRLEAEEAAISLDRDEVMRLAVESNLDIKLARIDAEYVYTDLDDAKSVFDAIISAGADYEDNSLKTTSSFLGSNSHTANYNFGVSKKLGSGATVGLDFTNKRSAADSAFVTLNPSHESAVELSVKQPIGKNLFGLADRGDVEVAMLNAEQADLLCLDKIEQALAQAEVEYWNIVFNCRVVELKKRMLDKAEFLYEVYSDRFSRGTAEKSDLFANKANVNIRRIDLREAENDVLNASNLLKLSLNINSASSLMPRDTIEVLPQKTELIPNMKQAINSRRDYLAVVKEVEAQKIEVTVKKNNLWPEIDLVASLKRNGIDGGGREAIRDVFDENNSDYYFGVNISLPLENRKAESQYKKAQLLKKKALISLKKLELAIVGELDNKVRGVNLDAEKIEKWSKVVKLEQAKLDEEQKRVMYGRSSSDMLIRFQNDLLSAQLNLARAYFEYRLSKVELGLAKNTILANLSHQGIIAVND
ncbi:MAG: TolC family protein [Candidatus Omnitrophica bacterium]|nr:TolC family protein [Candidatus Omnitrophota bacterium]